MKEYKEDLSIQIKCNIKCLSLVVHTLSIYYSDRKEHKSMLKYENVSAGFQKTPVINDISVSFPYGTLTAIIGPNGCGKSTLVQCLANKKLLLEGSITLDDVPLYSLTPTRRAKRIAFLPQIRELPSMNAETLVEQGRFPYSTIMKKRTDQDDRIIRRVMELTNTLDFVGKNIKTLSDGECQRVYLAMVLAQNSDYLILDEPTTSLDIKHRLEFLELLKTLRNQGKTILVILHDISEALQIADILVLMKEGKIISVSNSQEFSNNAQIEEVFQVQFKMKEEDNIHYTSFTL